jgi:CDP-glucose 4,6-dehydratase
MPAVVPHDGLDWRFWKGRRVLVTGHTGFKGAWLCRILAHAGAQVTGYALAPPTAPSLFELANVGDALCSVIGDVRDIAHLRRTFDRACPQVVFHLAAQPLVRGGYRAPLETFETNVMGTANVMECVRSCPSVSSVVSVTTDKVYRNRETRRGYREDDELFGSDPYAASKVCSELVTAAYRTSFLEDADVPVSTVRAGNVIGGGDFAPGRIVPDCVRSALAGRPIAVRNPFSVRPFQHVLEPLFAYMRIAREQAGDARLAGSYNIGPDAADCVTVGELVQLFCEEWGDGLAWRRADASGPHEAGLLELDCSRVRRVFGWRPVWDVRAAVRLTVAWTRAWQQGRAAACMDGQIGSWLETERGA